MAIIGSGIPQGQINHRYVKTYEEADALRLAGDLVPGAYYKISDTVTKHLIPNTDEIFTSETVEPLIIQALTDSVFSEEAESELYPNDIIRYDFTNKLCEDDETPRKGWITYREDTEKNIKVDGYDWRHCVSRRYMITEKAKEVISADSSTELLCELTFSTLNASWLGTTPRCYSVSIPDTVAHDAGELTLTLEKGAVSETKPLLKSDGTDTFTEDELADTSGQIVYDPIRDSFIYMDFHGFGEDLVGKYASISDTDFNIGYTQRYIVDEEDYEDYVLFPNIGDNVSQIKIGRRDSKGGLHNNVFFSNYVKYVTIGDNCYDNTFTDIVYDSTLGYNFYGNIVNAKLHWAISGNEAFNNYIEGISDASKYARNVTFGSEFYSNSVFLGAFGSGNLGANGAHENQIYLDGNTFNFLDKIEASLIYLTGSSGGTGRTGFSAHGYIRGSLLGYFDADNIVLLENLIFESRYEDSGNENILSSTQVKTLNIKGLKETAVGTVKLVGIDEEGDAVDGGSASGAGFVTLDTPQEITAKKDFPATGFRLVEDGGLGRQKVSFRSVSTTGAENVLFEPVLYINGNYDLSMTKGYADGRGWKFIMNPTAFRAYTWKDEDGTVAFLSDITPAKIVEALSSISDDEDKLPNTAIQGSPVSDDHFEFIDVGGVDTMFVKVLDTDGNVVVDNGKKVGKGTTSSDNFTQYGNGATIHNVPSGQQHIFQQDGVTVGGIDGDGNFYLSGSSAGIRQYSDNGKLWELRPSDTGDPVYTEIV